MATIEHSLYRAKYIRPSQGSFLHDELPARELFLRSVQEKPSAELREGYHWHIGNVQLFGPWHGYFAVGRTTTSTIEKFDVETGNFIEEELESSPYTHCVFDADIGFIGIARKSNLSPTTKGVATRLQQLLASTDTVKTNEITVEINPIPDPDGFLKALNNAYRILTFSATFGGPNPFDADAYFQRPLSVYLATANGTSGKAVIKGDSLDSEVLQEVTRSTAATGNQASAKIQKKKKQKPITITLKGDPIKTSYDENEHEPQLVIADLRVVYKRIRESEKAKSKNNERID